MVKGIFVSFLLSAAVFLAPSAHAERDVVHFFSNIHVPAGTSVHDAVCFFCNVHAEGDIEGDVVVFFGGIRLAGAAHHDVVDFFGGIHADDGASIGQDVVSFFGGIHLGENVSVGKDMVAIFGKVQAPDSVTVGNDRVIQPPWVLLIPLAVVGLIVFFIVNLVRSVRRPRYPFPPPQ